MNLIVYAVVCLKFMYSHVEKSVAAAMKKGDLSLSSTDFHSADISSYFIAEYISSFVYSLSLSHSHSLAVLGETPEKDVYYRRRE
jgi:hypothetical protein